MKITWFGGKTVRIHIGGQIIVADPPAGAGEIVSGADRVFRSDDPAIPDAGEWRPRLMSRLVDDHEQPVMIHRLAGGAILIDAAGEPPLVLTDGELPALGRWGHHAVIVAFDNPEAAVEAAPRLLALATADVESAIAVVRDRLDGTALLALEPGMGVEV